MQRAIVVLFGSVNRDAVWTAITIALSTFFVLGTVKLLGRWVMRDLREEIRQIVREEIRRSRDEHGDSGS